MKICQVDTCVISDILEDSEALDSFIKFVTTNDCIIGLSSYTLHELSKRDKIYKKFFAVFPSKRVAVLKQSEFLLKEELEAYPNTIDIKPIFIPPSDNFTFIHLVFTPQALIRMNNFLDDNKSLVLNRIIELKKAYPPNKSGKYSKEDRIEFVKRVTNQQLDRFNNEWYKSIEPGSLDFHVFKSMTAQLYITFFKFYILVDRKPKNSDIIDISISATFPYVDFVLTEKNMVNDIRQIKKYGMHFQKVEPFTLDDIKKVYT